MTKKILLIEDDDRLRRILQLVLLDAGYDVETAADGGEGIASWQQYQPDVVLTDLKMEPVDGLAVLRFGKEYDAQLPIIMLTAFGTVETAVSAMKDGAFDYLTKPVDNMELLAVVAEAFQSRQKIGGGDNELIGSSARMDQVRQSIKLFAVTDSSVLITGESGTGKELAARAVHLQSAHAEGPFVRVNCAAIPRELLESELFGHKKGSFTDATADRKGAFVQADGGTLFLDEIGDLPLELQPKLLHAVEEKMITPVGSSEAQQVAIKIVSASNQDLEKMLVEKTFRQDLYYRLNTVHLHMPPVREREGDLDLFLEYYLRMFSRKFDKQQPMLTAESLELLHGYPWPGNVREIRNVVERAVLTCKGGEITSAQLPTAIREQQQDTAQKVREKSTNLNGQEQQLIITVLQECNWNQSAAARKLGITRNTLRYRIKKHGILQV